MFLIKVKAAVLITIQVDPRRFERRVDPLAGQRLGVHGSTGLNKTDDLDRRSRRSIDEGKHLVSA